MPFTSLIKRLSPFLLAFAALLAPIGSAPLQAELRWSPEEGWRLVDPTPGEARKSRPAEALELMNEGRRLQEDERYIRALRRYRRVHRLYPDSVYAPEALFQSALIRIERRQWSQAFDALDTIVRRYPDYRRYSQVVGLQFRIATDVAEGARFRLFWVLPGFRNMERAVNMLDGVVSNAPYSDYAPVALAYMAQVEENRNRPEDAIDAYERLINDYSDHLLAPDAHLGLARSYAGMVAGPAYDQGSTRKAIAHYEDFMILYPDSRHAEAAEEELAEMRDVLARSKLIIGEFYHFRRDNYVAARVFYNEAITSSPTSPSADEARERLREIEGLGPGTGTES